MTQAAIPLDTWAFFHARRRKRNAHFRKWTEARSSSQIRAAAYWTVLACAIFLSSNAQFATAAVSRIEVLERTPLAGGESFGEAGAYELIAGRLHYVLNPAAPANKRVVDLKLAARDGAGRVTFAGDFVLIKPLDPRRANGRLLYGVNNRGNLIMLHTFNDADWSNAPRSVLDFGNGFLLKQGYTLLWSAWNWDVMPGHNRLQIDLPIATKMGRVITGPVAAEIAATYPSTTFPVAWGGSRGYAPVGLNNPLDRLTVRARPRDERQIIPRDHWRFGTEAGRISLRPVRVTLKGGFHPNRLYELVYQAKDPRVVGAGLAAIRDAISFFRYASADTLGTPNPLAASSASPQPGIHTALVYGFSQSARVIQHMLWQGFHRDEASRPVFEAAFIHGPGAGKGSFNHRFAQTTRHPSPFEDHLYPADFFPFATTSYQDPVSGKSASLLDIAQESGFVPKLFYLSSSTEYWTRAASLLHTDVQGRSDIPHDDQVRIYAVASAPHSVSLRTRRGSFENCHNPLDFRPLARALLVALDDWATQAKPPPPSNHPQLASGSLGTVAAYRRLFPQLPSIEVPTHNLSPPRLDHGPRFSTQGIADLQPALPGRRFKTLVPLPDEDGLDRGGIRLPPIAVPLGTYLGWNLRRTHLSEPRLGRWEGSFVPFHATERSRRLVGDPRPSIEERYPTPQHFLTAASATAHKLVRQGFLLPDDVPTIVARARRAYQALMTVDAAQSCEYLSHWRPN